MYGGSSKLSGRRGLGNAVGPIKRNIHSTFQPSSVQRPSSAAGSGGRGGHRNRGNTPATAPSVTVSSTAKRKTRSIFEVALKVHREVQHRDIEVGRNLGNWILRWLDKMKPAAQIRVAKPDPSKTNPVKPTNKQLTRDSSDQTPPRRYGITYMRNKDQDSSKRQFTSGNIWHAAYPTSAMMMRPADPAGSHTHYRHFNAFELKNARVGVIRNDIMQWMMQK